MYAPVKVPLNVPNLNRLLLGNYRLLLGDPGNLLSVHYITHHIQNGVHENSDWSKFLYKKGCQMNI